jgi:hypothetical protein
MILNYRQIKVIRDAIKWAEDCPPGVELDVLPITDPDDYDSMSLGYVTVNEYGYVQWKTEKP